MFPGHDEFLKSGKKNADGLETISRNVDAFDVHCFGGKSFDDIKKIKVETGKEKGIHFGVEFKINPEALNKMKNVGDWVQSDICFLQHNLVTYAFCYVVSLTKKLESGGFSSKIRVAPCTYAFNYPTEMMEGGLPVTFKPNVPELKDVKWILGNGKASELLKDDKGWYSGTRWHRDGTAAGELPDAMVPTPGIYEKFMNGLTGLCVIRNHTGIAIRGKDGSYRWRFEMTIDKDYFDIGKYINLNVKEVYGITVPYPLLDNILSGEKVPHSDWIIEVGEGIPRHFHVHGHVVANTSFLLKDAIENHQSFENVIEVIPHENRLILSTLKSEDMHVIFTYIYHRRFALPDYKSLFRIGRALSLLFPGDISNFIESWNAEIINNLMKLDRSSTTKTIVECVKALICASSAPAGALLGVYNVALIIGADAFQMAEAKGEDFEVKKIKKEIGEVYPINHLLWMIDDFKNAVCGAEKVEFIA